MLGVGKSLVKSLLSNHLKPEEKHAMEKALFEYDSSGFSRKLRSSLRLHGSFLGRDYKILVQQIPVVLKEVMEAGNVPIQRIADCIIDLGKLSSLVYVRSIQHNAQFFVNYVGTAYDDLRVSILNYEIAAKTEKPNIKDCNIYNMSKTHILSHLTADIARFDSPVLYKTESIC